MTGNQRVHEQIAKSNKAEGRSPELNSEHWHEKGSGHRRWFPLEWELGKSSRREWFYIWTKDEEGEVSRERQGQGKKMS